MFQPPIDSFEAKPVDAWGGSWPIAMPAKLEPWQLDYDLKQLFGIELAKGLQPFKAGLSIFPDDANKALWVSHYWKGDAVVIAARDIYVDTIETKQKLLDKDGLAVKLLEFADERHPSGFYINDAKDRLAALALYAKVQGLDKTDINNTVNNFIDNKLELVLVKSPKKEIIEATIIENTEKIVNTLPANIKLVGNSR